jgi:hypothetical protein
MLEKIGSKLLTLSLPIILLVLLVGCSESPLEITQSTSDEKTEKFSVVTVSGTQCDSIEADVNSLSDCEESNDYSCYYSLAIKKNDPSICDNLPGGWIHWDCYDCVAGVNKDLSICDDVDPAYLNRCLLTYGRAWADISVCKSINPEAYSEDECYVYVNVKGELSLCDNIQSDDMKDTCIAQVAILQQDTKICDQISTQEKKDSCYSIVGIQKTDISVCDKIETQPSRDHCFLNLARETQNASVCDQMEGFSKTTEIVHEIQIWKDRCYNEIGSAKKDKAICDKIDDDKVKGYCYRNIGVT